jgi:hypothetical protein
MRKTLELPTELWIDILKKTLAFPDLKAMSLACKRFRALATPRLFRCLCLSQSVVSGGDGTYYWGCMRTGPSDVRKLLSPSAMDQLLEFYGSERIAPLVRECWLSKYSYEYPIVPGVEVVLALLRRLPRLESIAFRSSNLDARLMHALEQLPALSSISMRSCTRSTMYTPHLRLKRAELHHDGSWASWPFTIDPDLLECLSVGHCGPPAASCLPNLRTLSVYTTSVFGSLDFLVNCSYPSLKVLNLSSTHQEYELPANVYGFPCLQEFSGPIRLAPAFAAGGSLLHVHLSEGKETVVIVDILHKLLPLAPNLVTLTVDVPYVTESVLRAALSFSHLEMLCLRSTSNERISVKACTFPPVHSQTDI